MTAFKNASEKSVIIILAESNRVWKLEVHQKANWKQEQWCGHQKDENLKTKSSSEISPR